MDFNFLDTYKDYSTADLLKIVQRPDDYQPAAVEAAKQLLNSRQVSDADVQQANEYFQNIENKKKKREEKVTDYKAVPGEFFESFIAAKKMPAKWLHYLLAFIALQYIWILYTIIKQFVYFFDSPYRGFDYYYSAILILPLIYTPVIFFLLYKKRKWGWILLFAINFYGVIMLLVPFVSFIYRPFSETGIVASVVAPIIIKAAFVIFLWRNAVAGFFNVTAETKKRTALVAGIIAAALLIYLYFGYVYINRPEL